MRCQTYGHVQCWMWVRKPWLCINTHHVQIDRCVAAMSFPVCGEAVAEGGMYVAQGSVAFWVQTGQKVVRL